MAQESAGGGGSSNAARLGDLAKINHTLIERGACRTQVSRIGEASFDILFPPPAR